MKHILEEQFVPMHGSYLYFAFHACFRHSLLTTFRTNIKAAIHVLNLVVFQTFTFNTFTKHDLSISAWVILWKPILQTIRYSMVRWGTEWYGTVGRGTIPNGTVRYGTAQYGAAQYGTVQNDTVRYGWNSTIQYSTVGYSMVEYGTVR